MQRYCTVCNKSISYNSISGLCQQCSIETRRAAKIEAWLTSGETGMKVDTTIRGVIREYILDSQNHSCAICGISDTWNNKKLNFILDHIDGNASNSSPSNIRLICPNCDSQLDTYKSKNKNSARTKRKKYLQEIRKLNK